MIKGETATFKSLVDFESSEGKIVSYVTLGKKIMFFTKDGTYVINKRDWKKLGWTPPVGEGK